jgi:hypothetical protein
MFELVRMWSLNSVTEIKYLLFHVVGTSFYLMSFSDYLTAFAFARLILRTGLGYYCTVLVLTVVGEPLFYFLIQEQLRSVNK